MASTMSPQRSQRLLEIAQEHGVLPPSPLAVLAPPIPPHRFAVPDDERKADAVLGNLKVEGSQSQSTRKSLMKGFAGVAKVKKGSDYSRGDLYDAISRVVSEKGLPGVLEALVNRYRAMGGDINIAKKANTGLLSRNSSANQPQRGTLVQDVTKQRCVPFLQILAPYADQDSLDQSLELALHFKDLAIIEVLLQYGANAALHQRSLIQAVETNDIELLSLLLRAKHRLPSNFLSQNLLSATTNGSFEVVTLLVQAGADGDHDNASAVVCAARTGQVKIAASILVGIHKPSGTSLDLAMTAILSTSGSLLNNNHALIEMLLCCGVDGNSANDGLLKATLHADMILMQLFLNYDVDINYNTGAAVAHCIKNELVVLIEEVLLKTHKLNPDTASELVQFIPRDNPQYNKISVLWKLLACGASGTYCSELLIASVGQNDEATVTMLLTYGKLQGVRKCPRVCSVDYNGARCLHNAIAQSNIPMVKLLIAEGQPSKFSLSAAFSSIPLELSEETRFVVAETLLLAGAQGPGVNEELHRLVVGPQVSNRSIELLIKGGATVTNETFLHAVSAGLVDTVVILLKGNVPPETCSAAIPLAMKLVDFEKRFYIIQRLLAPATSACADNPEISQAVIDVLREPTVDMHLLKLLCVQGKADINAQGGLAVELATSHDDFDVLKNILSNHQGASTSPSISRAPSIERGLEVAIRLPSTDKRRHPKINALLQTARPQPAMDSALIHEIKCAVGSNQSLDVIQLLLAAGANVNTNGGAPLWGSNSHPELTDLLLQHGPGPESLTKAFQQAMNLSEPARCILCEKLWGAGVVGDVNSKSMLHLLGKDTTDRLPLLERLIPRSDVNFNDGKALRIVVQKEFIEALDLLLNARPNVPSAKSKTMAFSEALHLQRRSPNRLLIINKLLRAKISKKAISEGVALAVQAADPELVEILLQHGASVDHNDGQAVLLAANLGHNNILKSLVSGELGAKPSQPVLTKCFAEVSALKGSINRESYYAIVQILLEAGVQGDVIHAALLETVREGDVNLKLSELLHINGASAEYNQGEAVIIATRSGHMETLGLLLRRALPENILKEAYVVAGQLHSHQRHVVIGMLLKAGKSIDRLVINNFTHATRDTPTDRQLIRLLLSYEVFDEGQSISHAATEQDMETLELLLNSPNSLPFVSTAFHSVVTNDRNWQSHRGIGIMKLMLEKGATGDPVGEALCKAAEKSVIYHDAPATAFLQVLLQSGADINYQQGRVLQLAVQQLDIGLVQRLLPHATTESKAMAIPLLFVPSNDSALVLKYLQAFIDTSKDADEKVFASFEHPDAKLGLVLFAALELFPKKPQIFRTLLDLGYSPNQFKMSEIDPAVGMEPDPILCWALSQPEQKVSNISIENLIEEGANVNFQSRSGFTPLILAIKDQRQEIVKLLIKYRVNVKVPDSNGVTPLAMASSLGNEFIMEYLLQACAECNDGSLHDAARELRCLSILLLVQYKHVPDYPSERHDGRSALAELCYKAVDYSPKPAQLEEAIKCLIMKSANIWLQCVSGERTSKTMLHYALDSSNPMLILPILLKLMWERVNDEEFLYKDSTHTYSLTKYVEKDIFKGPQSQKDRIIALLRNKRIIDKFWTNDIESDQPEDYCGAPDYIEAEVLRQKLRRKRIEEERLDTLATLDLKRLTAAGEVEIMNSQTEAEIRWANEKAKADVLRIQERGNTQLQLEHQAETQRDMFTSQRLARERDHMVALGNAQVNTQRSLTEVAHEAERLKNMMQIEFTDTRNIKDSDALRSRLAIQSSAQVEADEIATRQMERERKMRQEMYDENMARQMEEMQYNEQRLQMETREVHARLQIESAAKVGQDALEQRKHDRDMANKKGQGMLINKTMALMEKAGSSGVGMQKAIESIGVFEEVEDTQANSKEMLPPRKQIDHAEDPTQWQKGFT